MNKLTIETQTSYDPPEICDMCESPGHLNACEDDDENACKLCDACLAEARRSMVRDMRSNEEAKEEGYFNSKASKEEDKGV